MRKSALNVSRLALIALLAALAIFYVITAASFSAAASQPVPRTITGCVTQGEFISSNGYTINVRKTGSADSVDLRPFEGKRIRYRGMLLPGDRFHVRGLPEIIGRCPSR